MFSPRVFPLWALSPCCTRSVGGSEGSRSKEPAGPWMPGSPFALEAAPLPRATEEKHRGLKSLTPSPFPEWSLGLIPSGFPCLAPEDITQLWLKWHPELADASSGISPSHSPLPAHLPLLLPQIPDFQLNMQERWEVLCGESKRKAAPTAHPNFFKGFLNSHFTFLPQNISAAEQLCHSGMCDNSSAISISPGRRVEDGFAWNCCKVSQLAAA